MKIVKFLEADRLIIKLTSTDGFNKILALAETENVASRRVLEKCGFHHIGLKKCHYAILERYEIYRWMDKTHE